ncbi:hypothetical protein [Halorientalis salina]|uniref:hypothetical protein n=1 Tax=Halorientalis salina TaxID=2932266 RepID=UPI0010AD983B|nr:hypothetical protein [Halorientalis salina]
MRRRTFLAVMGAGALTGCNALGGNNFNRKEDAFSNVQNATGLGPGEVGQSARVTLAAGEYANFPFTIREESEMNITGQVTKNGPIDVYIMTADQFNQYQRQPNLVPSESEAESIKTIDLTQQFQSGEYLFVFDNTNLGDAEPSGEVEIEFEFVLTGTGEGGNTTTTQTP